MKKRLKFKKFVLPSIFAFSAFSLFLIGVLSYSNFKSNDSEQIEDIEYVSDYYDSNDTPVISEEKVLSKPYSGKNIKIGKYYYDYKDTADSQQNSIIYYEGSYIQNSGVDYISESQFDVLCIYDGTVSKVEDNDLVGKTIEIKHDNNLITIYQSLSDVKIKEGDIVSQGSVIAKSGKSKINNDLGNHIHVEMYLNGEVIDPESSYNKKITDL